MHKSRIKIWEMSLLLALCICLCEATIEAGRQEAISEKVLRLHVVASSDDEEAQALKLRVRDAAVEAIEEILSGAESLEEAEGLIKERQDVVLAAAKEASEGENVALRLGRERFDYREGDGCALPAGEYSALRIIIGEGQGHNWWGVIFPQLDLSGGYAESLSSEELRLIYDEEGVEVRFRLLEIWEKLLGLLGK